MDFMKYFTNLPGPLLLILGINAVAGKFLLGKDPPQVGPFVLILCLSIVLACLLYVLDRRRGKAERTVQELRQQVEATVGKRGEQRDFWTRPMLQLPLRRTVIDEVFLVFDLALRVAAHSLRQVIPDAEPTKVRANVFLPTSEGARDGDVCSLVIPRDDLAAPQGLQRNMDKEDERSITFRPNQGVTGRVFAEKRAIAVLTNPAWLGQEDPSKRRDVERWVYVRLHPDADFRQAGDSLFTESGKFEMTEFHNRRVAERLAWIISMPIVLKINKCLEVVGVFNVDCLEYQAKPEQLRAIYYSVAPFAGVLSGLLRELPTDRVAIFRFME